MGDWNPFISSFAEGTFHLNWRKSNLFSLILQLELGKTGQCHCIRLVQCYLSLIICHFLSMLTVYFCILLLTEVVIAGSKLKQPPFSSVSCKIFLIEWHSCLPCWMWHFCIMIFEIGVSYGHCFTDFGHLELWQPTSPIVPVASRPGYSYTSQN